MSKLKLIKIFNLNYIGALRFGKNVILEELKTPLAGRLYRYASMDTALNILIQPLSSHCYYISIVLITI